MNREHKGGSWPSQIPGQDRLYLKGMQDETHRLHSVQHLWRNHGWIGLILLIGVYSLYARPIFPIDETRYLTVAWEMWQSHSFLVPLLNGHPYSAKSPMLFWLIHLGWAVFGVNDWWPRLIQPALAIVDGWLTVRLARSLWPQSPGIAYCAPWLLGSCIYWLAFSTMVMFDLLLGACVLLAALGVWQAVREDRPAAWLLVGLALGLGLLAKGPVMFVHLLPVMLLLPLWNEGEPAGRSGAAHYGGVVIALLIGSALALIWALPAAYVGGTDYARLILWQESGGYVVHSFSHQRPWWWYLPLLPFMLMPWTIEVPVWRALQRSFTATGDAGIRFCAILVLADVILFSLISGKQPHYLLPALPFLSLIIARGLQALPPQPLRLRPLALLLLLLGFALLIVPHTRLAVGVTTWLAYIRGYWALPPLLLGVILWLRRWRDQDQALRAACLACALGVLTFIGGFLHASLAVYDLRPVALQLAQLEAAGQPWAFIGNYQGEFQFLGRLPRAPVEFESPARAWAWLRAHPQGLVVAEMTHRQQVGRPPPTWIFPYRGEYVGIWTTTALNSQPLRESEKPSD